MIKNYEIGNRAEKTINRIKKCERWHEVEHIVEPIRNLFLNLEHSECYDITAKNIKARFPKTALIFQFAHDHMMSIEP